MHNVGYMLKINYSNECNLKIKLKKIKIFKTKIKLNLNN